jgi:hypothetical protein
MASKDLLSQIDKLIAEAKGIDAKLLRDAAENDPRERRPLFALGGGVSAETQERIRELDKETLEQQKRRSTIVRPANEDNHPGRRPLAEHLAPSDPMMKSTHSKPCCLAPRYRTNA